MREREKIPGVLDRKSIETAQLQVWEWLARGEVRWGPKRRLGGQSARTRPPQSPASLLRTSASVGYGKVQHGNSVISGLASHGHRGLELV